jgi:uncharacterized ubiquitin-like protein YukD
MAIEVALQDHTGRVTRQVRMAEKAPVERLVPAIVTALGLPVVAGERPVLYRLSYNNRILSDDETLQSAGVVDGDALTIVPEMTASCFLPGTLIAGPDNSRAPIEDLMPGDCVTSLDARTRELCVGMVIERLVTSARDFMLINGRLTVTPSHFVFADDSWQRAGSLKPGQLLLALDGGRPPIDTLERLRLGPSKVYNLHPGNPEHTFEKEREEAQGSLVVRPVFGRPGADGQYECDVFMIMPFVEEFQSIYMDYIKPVVESFGLIVKRGDDFFSDRNIIDDIWSGIARCRLVVADCTGRNANVFYELGLAHTLGKPTILITQKVADLPFDVQGRRAIVYADNSRGLKNLEKQLRESISALNLTGSE